MANIPNMQTPAKVAQHEPEMEHSKEHEDETMGQTAPLTKEESQQYISGFKLFAVTGSLCLIVFLLLLDQSILSTATPQITSDFHSLPDVGWYAGAYQLSSAVFQPITGKLYTHFRAKWIFLIFTAVFELGSLICGVAISSGMLIGGRTIAGLGASALMNGGMVMIAGSVPLHKRPLYTGLIMGVGQLGIVIGPLVGGAFTQYITWRWCFYINLPLGGLAALLILLIDVPDITPKAKFTPSLLPKVLPDLDLLGFALFAPAMIMFLLALQLGGSASHPWNSPTIIGLLAGAAALIALFGWYESRVGERAMIPASILRHRVMWAAAGATFCFACYLFVVAYYMPIYFQAVRGAGPSLSGVYTLPAILSQLLAVIVTGAAVQRVGYYLPFVVVGTVMTTVACGLLSTLSPYSGTDKWVGYQILLGIGRGSSMQMSMIAAQNTLQPHQIPVAMAFLIFLQNTSAATFVVVATTIFSQSVVSELAALAPSVSPDAALAAGGGASAVRSLVPEGSPELDGVLMAFSLSLNKVFYLTAAVAAVAVLFSAGLGWQDTRKKPAVAKAPVTNGGSEERDGGNITETEKEKAKEDV